MLSCRNLLVVNRALSATAVSSALLFAVARQCDPESVRDRAAASYALKVFAMFDIAIIGDVMTKINLKT